MKLKSKSATDFEEFERRQPILERTGFEEFAMKSGIPSDYWYAMEAAWLNRVEVNDQLRAEFDELKAKSDGYIRMIKGYIEA